MDDIASMELNFQGKATYRIVLKGRIPSDWLDHFSDLKMVIHKTPNRSYQTILEGNILDQTELSAILKSIYNLHLPIIEVKWIKN